MVKLAVDLSRAHLQPMTDRIQQIPRWSSRRKEPNNIHHPHRHQKHPRRPRLVVHLNWPAKFQLIPQRRQIGGGGGTGRRR